MQCLWLSKKQVWKSFVESKQVMLAFWYLHVDVVVDNESPKGQPDWVKSADIMRV